MKTSYQKKRLGLYEIKRRLAEIRFSAELLIAIALLALDENDLSTARKILEIAKDKGHPLAKRYLKIVNP